MQSLVKVKIHHNSHEESKMILELFYGSRSKLAELDTWEY